MVGKSSKHVYPKWCVDGDESRGNESIKNNLTTTNPRWFKSLVGAFNPSEKQKTYWSKWVHLPQFFGSPPSYHPPNHHFCCCFFALRRQETVRFGQGWRSGSSEFRKVHSWQVELLDLELCNLPSERPSGSRGPLEPGDWRCYFGGTSPPPNSNPEAPII